MDLWFVVTQSSKKKPASLSISQYPSDMY